LRRRQSAGFIVTGVARFELWVEVADTPGNLAALAGELAACGANILHLDIHDTGAGTVVDRLVVQVPDARGSDVADVARRNGGNIRPLDDDHSPAVPVPGGPGDMQPVEPTRAALGDPPSPVRRTPVTLERLVAVPDGGLVRLRNLSPGDRNELAAHHDRCSETTRGHSRFHAAVADVDAWVSDGHVAVVALIGGDIVGAARYELADVDDRAEVFVIVEDAHQRRGIGSLLVNELTALAVNAGVTRLRAVAPTGGDALARTLRQGGLHYATHREGEALVLDCSLPHGFSATA
jgi:GNAT superfamily N-acetyltransferase